MKFQAAFSYMKHGRAITLPEWGGYWKWDAEKKTVMMHTRDGKLLDIRSSDDMDYTISFMMRDDWQLVARLQDTEHNRNINRPDDLTV